MNKRNLPALENQMPAIDGCQKVKIKRIDAWSLRQVIDKPVATSFGIMKDRPAVFVRIEDETGCFGWGEIFANWPAAGAEHRVNLLIQDISELVFKSHLYQPSDLFKLLSRQTRIRALQCGEWGPFNQVIAGLDIAIWDLFARQQGKSVHRLINAESKHQVPAYASGIQINDAELMLEQSKKTGFKNYKVKVGFDLGRDASTLNSLTKHLSGDEILHADANQVWNLEQATGFLRKINRSKIGWLEEPIAADSPPDHWRKLAQVTSIPLAGGENIAGYENFGMAINAGALTVFQPDIAKWGGFSGCYAVAKQAIKASYRYCPHFLGAGIGLSASAHLLAAVGGDGLLEVDVNPNTLRDCFDQAQTRLKSGNWQIKPCQGLGIESIPVELSALITLHRFAAQ